MRLRAIGWIASALCLAAAAAFGGEPLQTFVLQEHLGRRWSEELVHFTFDVPGSPAGLALTDERGVSALCQVSDAKIDPQTRRARGSIWTVVTLEPGGRKTFHLVRGKGAAGGVSVAEEQGGLVLSNERASVRLPRWSIAAGSPLAIAKLPAPLASIRAGSGPWLAGAAWFNDGAELLVKEARSEVLERGPVRAIVRQIAGLQNGQTYEATVELAAGQELAVVREQSTIEAPRVGFRLSLREGLQADHVFWHNQWKETPNAKSWALTDTRLDFGRESVVCKFRPWSFWWFGDLTAWAGFYRAGAEPLVGVLMLRPSRWSPGGWDGFDRTEIPVTAGPGGRLDLTFALAAGKERLDGQDRPAPLRRQWAITVGTVKDHWIDPTPAAAPARPVTPKLRRQLIQQSEFPLDEVKDYGFEFAAAKPGQVHPFLILTRADVDRVRRQAKTVPAFRETVEAARQYVLQATGSQRTLEKEGDEAFFRKNYWGNYLVEKLPEAYLGSEEPVFGRMMAAAVKGLTRDSLDTFLDAPQRPALGAYGPWFSEVWMRLVLNYDLIAGTGLLTPQEERSVQSALVFGAHLLAHPDYWNTARGLCSANPNMTNSIVLPRGMLALFLAGHPRSADWLRDAEEELKGELKDWVSPGGAWVENPGYQAASMDSLFLLAQAIRNVHGRDYFADPQFRATMDYYGFILTPPDRRFPPKPAQAKPGRPQPSAPMTLPAIGDGFAGYVTCYPGWIARATARSDPAYSARQQFYWKAQNQYLGSAGRAKGFSMALTDPELPAAPPGELARGFPGFGSVLRSSWTDPAASYVVHRTGPNVHHYHDDHGSIVYYAQGVPLCVDFGNCYQPVQRAEAWYHSRVSFNKGDRPAFGTRGELVEVRSLGSQAAYSHGRIRGGGNQQDDRHLLLVPPRKPQGAEYLLVRDRTVDGQPKQRFYWNLWCLAKEPAIAGSAVDFPGQFGVDLHVQVLAPAAPAIEKDHWQWREHIYVWGPFEEEQYGIRVAKQSSAEDFLVVLQPHRAGTSPAAVRKLAGGTGLKVEHGDGTDHWLFSPGRAAKVQDGPLSLEGEIAAVRQFRDGATWLASIRNGAATAGPWGLRSAGPVGITIEGNEVRGQSSGEAQEAMITLPAGAKTITTTLDDRPTEAAREGAKLTLRLPAGEHRFTVRPDE